MKIILLYSLFLVAIQQFLIIEAQNSLINAVTTYQVNVVQRTLNIDNAGYFIFTFPQNVYNDSQLVGIQCSPYSCSYSAYTLNISASQFQPSNQDISFSINNVTNPPSTQSPDYYSYELYDGTSTVIQTENGTLNFSPTSLSYCQIDFNPNFVRKVGTATIIIDPSSPLLAAGSIKISFPSIWSNIPVIYSQFVINSTANCQIINPPDGSIPCSVSNSTVTINNIFSEIQSSSFSISVNPILSLPINQSNNQQVSVATLDSGGNIIDDYTTCNVVGPNPNSFTLNYSPNQFNCSSNISINLNFISTDVITTNDLIIISIDGDTIHFTNNSKILVTISDGSNNGGGFLNINSTLSNSTTGYYMISSTLGKTKNAGATVTITGLTLLTPPSTKPSNSFSIYLMRGNGVYSQSSINLTSTSSSLSNLKLISTDYLVNAQATYTISFNIYSPLSQTGQILITFPPTIVISSNTSCLSIVGVNISNNFTSTITNNQLLISNIFLSNVASNSSFIITIGSVNNPPTTQPTIPFSIITYYDSSNTMYSVDFDSSSLIFTSLPDIINQISVNSSNSTVGSQSFYSLTYINKNSLPINSSIIIGLPAQLSLSNNQISSAIIAINQTDTPIIPIIINNGTNFALNFTSINPIPLISGTNITLTFGLVINLNSTIPTTSFSIYSYSSQYLIESQITGITIAMSTPRVFTDISISPSNQINGNSANYSIIFTPSVFIPTNSTMTISIPPEVQLNNPKCYNETDTEQILNCTLIANILSIVIATADGSSLQQNSYIYIVTGFVNPRTFAQSSSFTINTFTKDNYSMNQETVNGISNNQANNIVMFNASVLNPAQSYLNSTQQILFTVTTFNYLTNSDFIQIIFPPTYTYNTSNTLTSVCSQSLFSCVPQLQNNNLTINITGLFNNNTNFAFTINNYISPTSFPASNNYFLLNTYTSDGNTIDIIDTTNPNSQVLFSQSCDPNCQTCDSSNISICLTCYPSSISSDVYLQNGNCVSNCNNLTYPDPNSDNCIICVVPCLTCINQTICLSCVDSTISNLFIYYNNSCLGNCPTGYYSDTNNICQICDPNCVTCDVTAMNCTSCNATTFLDANNTCVSVCLPAYFNSSGFCFPCDISCSTCLNSATFCLTCSSEYVKNGTTCTNNCIPGTVPYDGLCQCDISCLTCSILYNNCTSCNQSSIYLYEYNNSCLTDCMLGTYLLNFQCYDCPQGCSDCTSILICNSCSNGYYLYSSVCNTTCPSGYFMFINLCNTCQPPCFECSIISTNCTSCISPNVIEGNICKPDCSIGIKTASQDGYICLNCDPTCQNCTGLITNCTSCSISQNLSLDGNECVSTCPISSISLNNICVLCLVPCLTCSVTTSNCLTCTSNYYTINQSGTITCVDECKSHSLFINNDTCSICLSPCANCLDFADVCINCVMSYYLKDSECLTQCPQNYYIFKQTCTLTCPENYTVSQNLCTQIIIDNKTNLNDTDKNKSTNSTVKIYEYKIIQYPFAIGYGIAIFITLISKLSFIQTYFPAMALSLCSTPQYFSWGYLIYVIIFKSTYISLFDNTKSRLLSKSIKYADYGLIIILIACAFHYILNIMNTHLYCKYVQKDRFYSRWIKSLRRNQFIHIITILLNLLISHKISALPFSRMFSLSIFSANIQSVRRLKKLNYVICAGLLNSIIFIIGYIIIIYDNTMNSSSQTYGCVIQAMIITLLNALLGIWTSAKDDGFLKELNAKKGFDKQEFHINQTLQNINDEKGDGLRKKSFQSQISKQHIDQDFHDYRKASMNFTNVTQHKIDIHADSEQYISEDNEKIEFEELDNTPKKNIIVDPLDTQQIPVQYYDPQIREHQSNNNLNIIYDVTIVNEEKDKVDTNPDQFIKQEKIQKINIANDKKEESKQEVPAQDINQSKNNNLVYYEQPNGLTIKKSLNQKQLNTQENKQQQRTKQQINQKQKNQKKQINEKQINQKEKNQKQKNQKQINLKNNQNKEKQKEKRNSKGQQSKLKKIITQKKVIKNKQNLLNINNKMKSQKLPKSEDPFSNQHQIIQYQLSKIFNKPQTNNQLINRVKKEKKGNSMTPDSFLIYTMKDQEQLVQGDEYDMNFNYNEIIPNESILKSKQRIKNSKEIILNINKKEQDFQDDEKKAEADQDLQSYVDERQDHI